MHLTWTMKSKMSTDQKNIVAGLVNGLSVIRAFGEDRPEMSLSQVAEITGLTRATARRALLTLEHLGYVRSTDRDYQLTPKILDLGYSYLSSRPFIERLDPFVLQVAQQTGESCSVGIRADKEVVYVARRTNNRIMSVTLNVGTRLPVPHTSMGRVLLAWESQIEIDRVLGQETFPAYTRQTQTHPEAVARALVEVRQNGYALVDQELEEGLRSLAVPLRNSRGEIIAALNVGCSAMKVSTGKMENDYLPILLEAAAQAAKVLD